MVSLQWLIKDAPHTLTAADLSSYLTPCFIYYLHKYWNIGRFHFHLCATGPLFGAEGSNRYVVILLGMGFKSVPFQWLAWRLNLLCPPQKKRTKSVPAADQFPLQTCISEDQHGRKPVKFSCPGVNKLPVNYASPSVVVLTLAPLLPYETYIYLQSAKEPNLNPDSIPRSLSGRDVCRTHFLPLKQVWCHFWQEYFY